MVLQVNLELVDVADNQLESLEPLAKLENLTDIWANDNKISSWPEVDKLSNLPRLETIYLERNPIYKEVRIPLYSFCYYPFSMC